MYRRSGFNLRAASVSGALLALISSTTVFAACVPADCDDQNECTIDFCDPALDACTHRLTICNDDDVCTADGCNPATGCVHTDISQSCDDGNACTRDCDPRLGCHSTPILCDDGNVCTADSCDPATGCVHTAVTTCDDGDPCTVDLCDAAIGCRHVPDPGCVVAAPLELKLAGQIGRTSFKRKGGTKDGTPFVKITTTDTVTISVDAQIIRRRVKVNAVVTGDDADVGSLLYPVAALGLGAGAVDALEAQGFDIAVAGVVESCQDVLAPTLCGDLARQLAKAIDGALGPGIDGDRDAFRRGAAALGFPPDVCVVP